jgi:hypothetical protein
VVATIILTVPPVYIIKTVTAIVCIGLISTGELRPDETIGVKNKTGAVWEKPSKLNKTVAAPCA